MENEYEVGDFIVALNGPDNEHFIHWEKDKIYKIIKKGTGCFYIKLIGTDWMCANWRIGKDFKLLPKGKEESLKILYGK